MNIKDSSFKAFPRLNKVPANSFPNHIAIIPDGNRRYARQLGKPILFGHKKGFDKAMMILRAARELPIRIVTLWAFSSDNWKRNEKEVKNLMKLYKRIIEGNIRDLIKDDIRFVHIGRKDRIPQELRESIEKAEESTKNNNRQILCIALDFGGSDQEVRKTQKIVEDILGEIISTVKAKKGKVNGLVKHEMEKITPELLKSYNDAGGKIPSADLIIRTSEKRTSDVGWLNGAQTELHFLNKLFPEIELSDVEKAILDFAHRERRLGA